MHVFEGYEDLGLANKENAQGSGRHTSRVWLDYGGVGEVEANQTEVTGYGVSIAWTQRPVGGSYYSFDRWSWRKKLFVIPLALAYMDLVSRGQKVERVVSRVVSRVGPAQQSDLAGEGHPYTREPLGEPLHFWSKGCHAGLPLLCPRTESVMVMRRKLASLSATTSKAAFETDVCRGQCASLALMSRFRC